MDLNRFLSTATSACCALGQRLLQAALVALLVGTLCFS
jgi:hypothetical protein